MVVASLASVVWPCGVAIRVGLALFVSVFVRFSVINRTTFFLINETGKAFASCFEKKKMRRVRVVQSSDLVLDSLASTLVLAVPK